MTTVHVCASSVHKVMHGKVWIGTIGSKSVKHTLSDQNMVNMFNHGKSQKLELIGVQNNSKIPLEHFIKHLICNIILNMWAMHEHVKICLNTCKIATWGQHRHKQTK